MEDNVTLPRRDAAFAAGVTVSRLVHLARHLGTRLACNKNRANGEHRRYKLSDIHMIAAKAAPATDTSQIARDVESRLAELQSWHRRRTGTES